MSMTLDDVAAFMALASSGKKVHRSGAIDLTYFKSCEVFLPELLGEIETFGAERSYYVCKENAEVTSNMDVSMIHRAIDADFAQFALGRIRRVTAKDVRGKVGRLCRYMVADGAAFVYRDGRIETSDEVFMGSSDGMTWFCIGPKSVPAYGHRDEQSEKNVVMSQAISFAREYDWIVDLGYEGFPSIRIPTDPEGAREVFRLRDMPEGKSRRSALLHWVSQHYRKSRVDEALSIQVRKHLRGATSFVWNGLRCRIAPSQHDVRRLGRPPVDATGKAAVQ